MACEGCSLKFNLIRRKKKCEDCNLIFCAECTNNRGRLYQCYRCKVLTCIPLNGTDVASLKLRDLQWFLDTKGINVPSNDRREKPALVDWVMNYSRHLSSAQPGNVPTFGPPSTQPEGLRGLFGDTVRTANTFNEASRTDQSSGNSKENIYAGSKHQIIELDSVGSRTEIFDLSNMELKVLLTRNFISFRGCCEKSELQEKVCWLWDIKEAARGKKAGVIADENLCKICMESLIDSLLLDCGHMVACTTCGKMLHDCPICRQVIVRVVRAFRS